MVQKKAYADDAEVEIPPKIAISVSWDMPKGKQCDELRGVLEVKIQVSKS